VKFLLVCIAIHIKKEHFLWDQRYCSNKYQLRRQRSLG